MILATGPVTSLIEFVSQPWHWAVSGAMISLVLFLLTWLGRSFGMSTTFKALCTAAGAGKRVEFFNLDLKTEHWRLAFAVGTILGAIIAANFLSSPAPVDISDSTVSYLQSVGVSYPAADAQVRGFLPTEVFNFGSAKGIILAILGGFLVGFGARYGDGCTSGHAISGLAHLQLPSLLTVVGFFIGGLLMAHFILPHLLTL